MLFRSRSNAVQCYFRSLVSFNAEYIIEHGLYDIDIHCDSVDVLRRYDVRALLFITAVAVVVVVGHHMYDVMI